MRRAKKGLAILASTVLMVTSAVNYHGLTFSTNVYSEETSNAETVSEVENIQAESETFIQPVAPIAEVPTEAPVVETQTETIAQESSIENAEEVTAETESTAAITMVESESESVTENAAIYEISEESSETEDIIELPEDETDVEIETETEIETEIEASEEISEAETEEEISEEETEFEDGITAMSLLPLEEVTAYLDLENKTVEEISDMLIDEVLNLLQDSNGNKILIPEKATTAWKKDDSHKIEQYIAYPLGQNKKINLSNSSSKYTMELIVGSGSQLNKNNRRYLITVVLPKSYYQIIREDEISYKLYVQDESGVRTQVVPDSTITGEKYWFFDGVNKVFSNIKTISVHDPNYWNGKEYYLELCPSAINDDIDIDVFTYEEFVKLVNNGQYDGLNAKTCTDQILNQDMTQKDSGMKGTYENKPNDNTGRLFCIRYRDPKGQ